MALSFYDSWRKVSSTPSEYWNESLQAFINEQFENASNVYNIQKLNTLTNLYEDIIVRLDLPYKLEQNSSRADDFRKVTFKNNNKPPVIGDMYKIDNDYWICVDKKNLKYPTISCIIQRCNNTITLVKNNITYNIPCCVEGSVQLYRLRLEENKYLSNVDDNIIIRVPNNSTTILMNVNDVYKIGKWNYKLTNISDVVEPGLLILKFEIVFDEQELPTYTISILNGESLQIAQSQSLTLNVGVYEDGELLTTPPPYSFVSSDETIATVNNSGVITFLSTGNVNITVNLDSNTEIQDTIAIEVIEVETDNITYKIIGEDEIINEYSEHYTVQKLNNGSVVSGEFTFSVVGGTATSNDYTLSIIDGNNVNITAKNKNVSIILRAIDSSDITKYIDKTIKFVSLF